MKLFTAKQRAKLLANGAHNNARRPDTTDFPPVVKLFYPVGAATWLLSEIDPEDPDIAFGLCDLGFGSPEMGSVSIRELEDFKGRMGLRVERDLYFEARHTLSEYADAARLAGRIVA
jgi:hypothetical protein